MREKYCPTCKQTKPTTEFYKNKSRFDGLAGRCKMCDLARTKAYHQTEAGKATLKRAQTKFLATGKGKVYNRAATKRWHNSDKGKAYAAEKQRQYRRQYRLRWLARGTVNDAVRYGKLPAADTQKCDKCPNQAEHYHHHNGYEREYWLDVIPLCIECHTITEMEIKQ